MLLQNDELTIRRATAADAETLARWWNDGAVMAHAGFPNGLGTTAEQIARSLATDAENVRERLILQLDGAPIGEMNYRAKEKNAENRNSNFGTAEIGIKICEPAQQERGLGKRALSMLISELFARGFEKIELDTNAKNTRAQHVYETLGFARVRVNVDSWKDQLGEMQSSVDYELTPDNFVDFRKI